MRKRTWLLSSLGVLALVGIVTAQDQGAQAVVGNVFLQNATPGLVQAGHASIGGTFRAGQVNVTHSTGTTIPLIGNNTALGPGSAIGGSFSSALSTGIGVRGTTTETLGRSIGVLGEARSPLGAGVVGKSISTTNGVGNRAAGVYGEAASSAIPGVLGFNALGTGVVGITDGGSSQAGIIAINSGVGGQGLYASGSTGIVAGGGRAASDFGISATAANGGRFEVAFNSNGTACRGSNSQAVSTGYGVYGRHFTANGFAVFAEGKTGATGTKSSVIDHPSDPTNKTLSHHCTEGEEPLNVYRGHVTTDGAGSAWVRLSDYFDEINADPTVQLTVADSSPDFVMAKVAREVAGRRFQVRTSKPGVKVYWRVEARRNDRWMRAYGAPVEAMTPEFVRGTYMRPELYGKPQTLSEDAKRFPTTEIERPAQP